MDQYDWLKELIEEERVRLVSENEYPHTNEKYNQAQIDILNVILGLCGEPV